MTGGQDSKHFPSLIRPFPLAAFLVRCGQRADLNSILFSTRSTRPKNGSDRLVYVFCVAGSETSDHFYRDASTHRCELRSAEVSFAAAVIMKRNTADAAQHRRAHAMSAPDAICWLRPLASLHLWNDCVLASFLRLSYLAGGRI
jgi:hypothetical protein